MITLHFDEKIINHVVNKIFRFTCRNISYFYLKKIYSALDLSSSFDPVCKGHRIAYDPNLQGIDHLT